MKRKSPDLTIEALPKITSSQQEQYTNGSPLNQALSNQHIVSIIGHRYSITPTYARLVAQHHFGMAI